MRPIDCVMPLFGSDSSGSLEVIGSGILIQIGPRVFLLSASHVFTGNADTTVYYPSREGAKVLLGTRCGAKSNKEDVTYFLLDDVTAKDIAWSYAALPSFFIEMNDQTSQGDHYCLTGFPEDIQNANPTAKVFSAQRFAYNAKVADERIYRKCKVNRASHIVVEHSNRQAKDKSGCVIIPPSLHCMSGGAVWKHLGQEFSLPGLPAVRLVGITIEKRNEWGAAVATRINYVMEAIRNNFSELSLLIPSSSTIKIELVEARPV